MKSNKILEISKERLVARELNFDFGCFFYPQEKRKVNYTRTLEKTVPIDKLRESKVTVEIYPSRKGNLTTYDERVFYVLIEMWTEQGKPPKVIFSLRQLAEKLDLQWCGGRTAKTLEDSLMRLRICEIHWNENYYSKSDGNYLVIKNPFTILNHLSLVTTEKEGVGRPMSEFSFDERTLKNLHSSYCRPINLDAVLSFKSPIAQSVYIHLDRQIYGTNEYSRTSTGLLIDDLQLVAKGYKSKSKRVEAIKRIIPELIGKPLGYNEVISDIQIKSELGRDAIITVTRSGTKKAPGKVITSNKFTFRKPDIILDIPDKIKKVLEEFAKQFLAQQIPLEKTSKKVIKCANSLIKEHGEEAILYSIKFLKKELEGGDYKPDTFNGIVHLLPRALEAYKAHIAYQDKERTRRQKKLQQQQAAKIAQESDKRRDKYQAFVLAQLNDLKETSCVEYQAFKRYEKKLWEKEEPNHKPVVRDAMKKWFFSTANHVDRAVEFFEFTSLEEWENEQKAS